MSFSFARLVINGENVIKTRGFYCRHQFRSTFSQSRPSGIKNRWRHTLFNRQPCWPPSCYLSFSFPGKWISQQNLCQKDPKKSLEPQKTISIKKESIIDKLYSYVFNTAILPGRFQPDFLNPRKCGFDKLVETGNPAVEDLWELLINRNTNNNKTWKCCSIQNLTRMLELDFPCGPADAHLSHATSRDSHFVFSLEKSQRQIPKGNPTIWRERKNNKEGNSLNQRLGPTKLWPPFLFLFSSSDLMAAPWVIQGRYRIKNFKQYIATGFFVSIWFCFFPGMAFHQVR